MAKISRRGGFSDRNKIKPENTEIQLKDFDKRTRTKIQNLISQLYGEVYGENLYYLEDYIQNFLRFILGEVYSESVDVRKIYQGNYVFDLINNSIQNDDYDDVLTLIEAITQYWDQYLRDKLGYRYYNIHLKQYQMKPIYERVNEFFEKEYIGYRFLNQIIVPISDEYEFDAVRDALENRYQPVQDHLAKANRLLADRDSPDYENSIKESISAVETICEIITGLKGKEATLGNMLKKLNENGVVIHPGLKSAFNTLYGYTSDANGIRHAGDIGGPSSTFEEAKFMLVTCSAFINYLLAVSAD